MQQMTAFLKLLYFSDEEIFAFRVRESMGFGSKSMGFGRKFCRNFLFKQNQKFAVQVHAILLSSL
jgi:hypothetical protein